MRNALAYLDDTFKFNHETRVAKVDADEHGAYVTVEESIFYPQGGGQPWDVGTIDIDGEGISVSSVRFVEGEARIYGPFSPEKVSVGDAASQSVDQERRLINAKSHTAGHLVANVVEEMDLGFVAIKGYHFPDGSYVEFSGLTPESTEEVIAELNRRLADAIAAGVSISARCVMLDELTEMCNTVPPGLPSDKPLRVVRIGEFSALPCGGTHVDDLTKLNSVVVTKIKRKKPNIRFSYTSS